MAEGKRNVWDFPRPPAVEPCKLVVRVVFNGETIAETSRALMVLETSHPPTYYIPPEDVRQEYFKNSLHSSYCEWKGLAAYKDVVVGGKTAEAAAWCYPEPVDAFADLKDHYAFYPEKMDACYVGDEQVQLQEGNFYGGWITRDLEGPFKGAPGTQGW